MSGKGDQITIRLHVDAAHITDLDADRASGLVTTALAGADEILLDHMTVRIEDFDPTVLAETCFEHMHAGGYRR